MPDQRPWLSHAPALTHQSYNEPACRISDLYGIAAANAPGPSVCTCQTPNSAKKPRIQFRQLKFVRFQVMHATLASLRAHRRYPYGIVILSGQRSAGARTAMHRCDAGEINYGHEQNVLRACRHLGYQCICE